MVLSHMLKASSAIHGDEIYVAQCQIVEAYVTVNPNIKDWDPTTMMETGYLTVIDSNGKEVYPEPSHG